MKIKSIKKIPGSGMNPFAAGNLWDKIEVFAGYAFNKSHSVEYTIISWWAMWLKTHYPAEFYAASLTTVDREDKVSALVLDARKRDIDVLPPDINLSSNRIEIRGERELLAPFQAVKGCSENAAAAIMQMRREAGGAFKGRAELEELLAQHKLAGKCNKTVRDRLDAVGAFVSIDGGLPALHPDRLKDRLEFMAGFTVDSVKADRRIEASVATAPVIRLIESLRACEGCSLKGGVHPVPRMGKTPKFMVVFDAPTWQEEKANKLFEGDSATYFKAALKDAGLSGNDCYVTALVKSPKPKGTKMLANEMINGCAQHLKRELEIVKPPVIVAMGSAAARFFVPSVKGSTSELVGKVVYDPALDASIVFGINPAQVIFDPSKVAQLQAVAQKIAELVTT
jgi:DNA polymerase III subunit alpha